MESPAGERTHETAGHMECSDAAVAASGADSWFTEGVALGRSDLLAKYLTDHDPTVHNTFTGEERKGWLSEHKDPVIKDDMLASVRSVAYCIVNAINLPRTPGTQTGYTGRCKLPHFPDAFPVVLYVAGGGWLNK
ncbi:hypothetical protein WJX81_008608 [Elliptochloris bilobata]|uniref:Uncharacterized protein n=1 Tax=Elliptochloris bilobata TaxID=381761 RepID=A0AAW1RIP3_9CHLO